MKPTIADLKYHNPEFFSSSTRKFFGREKRKIVQHSNGHYYLQVQYIEKFPRTSYWRINEEDNFRLTHGDNPFMEVI